METLSAFFIGVAFWPLLVALTILVIITLEFNESNIAPTLFVIGTLFLLHTAFNFKVLITSIRLDYIGIYVSVYIIIGVGWSVVRYWDWLHEQKEKYATNSDDLKYRRPSDDYYSPAQQKGRLVRWMMFWPWSILYFIVNKLFYRLFNHIYRWMYNIYMRIYESVFPPSPTV